MTGCFPPADGTTDRTTGSGLGEKRVKRKLARSSKQSIRFRFVPCLCLAADTFRLTSKNLRGQSYSSARDVNERLCIYAEMTLRLGESLNLIEILRVLICDIFW